MLEDPKHWSDQDKEWYSSPMHPYLEDPESVDMHKLAHQRKVLFLYEDLLLEEGYETGLRKEDVGYGDYLVVPEHLC